MIMRQILIKTSHNYRFEDWGDEELLEKMREKEDAEDSDDVSTHASVMLDTYLGCFHIRVVIGLLYRKLG